MLIGRNPHPAQHESCPSEFIVGVGFFGFGAGFRLWSWFLWVQLAAWKPREPRQSSQESADIPWCHTASNGPSNWAKLGQTGCVERILSIHSNPFHPMRKAHCESCDWCLQDGWLFPYASFEPFWSLWSAGSPENFRGLGEELPDVQPDWQVVSEGYSWRNGVSWLMYINILSMLSPLGNFRLQPLDLTSHYLAA